MMRFYKGKCDCCGTINENDEANHHHALPKGWHVLVVGVRRNDICMDCARKPLVDLVRSLGGQPGLEIELLPRSAAV